MPGKLIKTVKIGLRVILTSLAAICTVIALLFGYIVVKRASGEPLPTVFGWGNAIVMSGSMEPNLPVGSLLLIRANVEYFPGEIVTYVNDNGTLVTHRLVSVENGTAITKGDANNATDAPFPAEQIRGKVRKVYPGLGNFLLKLRSPAGVTAILLFGFGLVFLSRFIIRKAEVNNEEYKR